MKLVPPLTQAEIDRPTEPRRPILAVTRVRRSYWGAAFWCGYIAVCLALAWWVGTQLIPQLVLWLVR